MQDIHPSKPGFEFCCVIGGVKKGIWPNFLPCTIKVSF